MRKIMLALLLALVTAVSSFSQTRKLYNEQINPLSQIEEAVQQAACEGKFVICQVGGNWCIWCLRFAAFIEADEEIKILVDSNFKYIHVNYPRKDAPSKLARRLGNPARFGFPSMVVLDSEGKVIHIQDSSFLESGNSYDREKVLRFFQSWTPEAVRQ